MTLQSIGGDSDGSEAASHLQLDKHAEHKVWTGRLQLLSAFSETSGADDAPTRSIWVRIRRKNGVCFHVRRPIEVWVNAVREFPEPKLRHSQFGALLPCRRDGMPTTRS